MTRHITQEDYEILQRAKKEEALQRLSDFTKEAEYKPVAWRCKKFFDPQEGWFYNENEIGEPLYTHPAEHDLGIAEAIGFDKGYKSASVKDLTDEDMLDCLKKVDPEAVRLPKGFKLFAEELLRKAQEK